MINRCVFLSLYFFSFFALNRWHDLYEYYFHFSPSQTFIQQTNLLPKQLNIKQLQHILHVRGITYANVHEKFDLIQIIEQSGSVRERELNEPIEDDSNRPTTIFTSYKQLLDLVDDCKDAIWFVHLRPIEQSSISLSIAQWKMIERRLAMFGIQTGSLNCSNQESSSLCRISANERLLLLVPSMNRRSTSIYSFDLLSPIHCHYQHILKWLTKALQNHIDKDTDWYELTPEKRPILEFTIDSFPPLFYFTLLLRYASAIDFRLIRQQNTDFHIIYYPDESRTNSYIFNDQNSSSNLHEIYSFRSLNMFLLYLTINTNTLMYLYFIILNVYLLYDLYLLPWYAFLKHILLTNFISACFWLICLTYSSTILFDNLLQTISFDFIYLSRYSWLFSCIRNDLFVFMTMSKWILYPWAIVLHISTGFCLRWCEKDRLRMMENDIPSDVLTVDPTTHALCSRVWQFVLCILFSDRAPIDYDDNTILHFAQESLWLDHQALITPIPNVHFRPQIDFERLPVWRFAIRRRTNTIGASESYSDIELEQPDLVNQSCRTHLPNQQQQSRKVISRRRTTTFASQNDNFYTSESEENKNKNQLNSSQIYQCAICLEKYLANVFICTLPCLHHFHQQCLFNWFRTSDHGTCPLCRSPVLVH